MEFNDDTISQLTETNQLQDTASLQDADALIFNKPATSTSQQASLSYIALIGNAENWGPYSKWDDKIWDAFKEYIEKENPSGEEVKKTLGYTRRDKLENLFYKFSEREEKLYSIRWENDYSKGERSLPALKTGKEGLRISYIQLKRLGIKVPRNTYCKIKRLEDNEISIKFYIVDNSQ